MSSGRPADAKLFIAHAGLFSFSETIFILSLPILFFEQGFSMAFIFAFHGLASLPGYFFTHQVIRYMLKTNITWVLIIGVLLYILLGCTALLIASDNWWWSVALVLLAAQALFYWPARHLYFAEIAHEKTVGLQTGVLSAVSLIARVIAPLSAALLALLTEFNSVFLLGALVMLFSIVPIFFIRTKAQVHFDFAEFAQMSKNHAVFRATRWAYLADGMNGIFSYLLWPLLFFILLAQQDYFELGTLMTVTSAISAGIMVIVGHYFDRQHRKQLLGGAIGAHIIASLGRFALLFFHPIAFLYGVQSLYAFSESALQATFDAYLYSYGKATSTTFFTIHRERNYALGRFVLCLIIAGVSLMVADVKQLWFLFLGSIPLLILYGRKRKVDGYLGT